ncbi:MAG: sugar nucleotide-binding protein [Actinomycetota bacterium]|nr:sugar nucleotide-binding protein [Actinomycetota bacterium]
MRWTRHNKRLMLITGAGGFLGRHLMMASEAGDWEVLAPSSRSMDVRTRARVTDEITTWKPQVVVHLAYRRDDRQVIVDGTRNVAEAAAAVGARLIHMSSDMVFAGREWPYHEGDRPDATMDYGRWKAEAEAVVLHVHPGAVMVRTSLLYGTETQAAIQTEVADTLAGRRTTRFFTDEYRCPAHAADVATAIVALADRPDVKGPLHVAGPQALSRADLARAFAAWMGYDPARVPVSSLSDSGLQRPGVVVLDCTLAATHGIRCRSVEQALAR